MYWHIHHDVLAEFAIAPIEERIAFIRANKPAREIEMRLRLMRPVQHKLFGPALEAALAYRDGMIAIRKARIHWHTACDLQGSLFESRTIYTKHKLALCTELVALHKSECPGCSWNGKTIFPDKSAA